MEILRMVMLLFLAVFSGLEAGIASGEKRTPGKILVYPYGHCLTSHLLNFETLTEILLEEGHEVHLLVSDGYHGFQHLSQDALHAENLRFVQFKAPQDFVPICDHDSVDYVINVRLSLRFHALIQTAVRYCDSLLADRELLAALKAMDYDLFILEAVDPCSRVLADYLDIPFIPLMTTGLGMGDGNPRPPSYLPTMVAPFTDRMTFMQRAANLLVRASFDLIPQIMGFEPAFEALKQKHGLNTSLSLTDTFNRASLKFVNSDFALEYASPVEPDTILVGGFAIKEAGPLPSDLDAFMDSAGDDGVIVMSFGTVTKRYDSRWTRVFAEAFARLPQKVIWRYYGEERPDSMNISDNVRLVQWLPQVDILADPRTRLIVSHCGLNTLFEASYYGVPIVGIPLFGDQLNHAVRLEHHLRVGLGLDVYSLTADILHAALVEVLSNPGYRTNAAEAGRRLRDQPLTPRQKIKFWAGYVIRHQGAPHLKSRAHQLTWYQYYSLDVIGFYVVTATLVLVILAKVVMVISNYIFGRLKFMLHFSKMKVS